VPGIPDCLGPRPASRPRWRLPEGAWDTHFHALGPQARFPYSPKRKYTPPDAPLEACLALHDRLGIARGLVVHANTHGFDNSVDLDAVARSGGRYLAVVRLDATATRDACAALHAAGARGVRFAFNPQHGGTLDHGVFDHVLRCVEGLGWFVELHFGGAELPGLRSWIESIPATIVIDHMGRVDPPAGDQVSALLALAKRENVWFKISGLERLSKRGAPYTDVRPLVERLVEAVPARLVWGSDWPHTGFFDGTKMPDDGALLDAFADCVPDEGMRRRILVDNPERLLGLA
jgi:predicted TIM-barrel fold metal-dependent hydrolase